MAILFKTTKALEDRIDNFLDAVSEGLLAFSSGVEDYISGRFDRFNDHLETVARLEGEADGLRRRIETKLYSQSLIPEHQGSVLRLLETIDDLIDTAKKTLRGFVIEKPVIPGAYHDGFIELARISTSAAESAVLASRSYFRDLKAVKDHLHKTYYFEREADTVCDRLKERIFADDELELARKMHLRYFVHYVDRIADQAQDVADRLTIDTIKRSL